MRAVRLLALLVVYYAVLAGLALAKVQYATMLKWVMKVIVVTGIVLVVVLTAAMLIM